METKLRNLEEGEKIWKKLIVDLVNKRISFDLINNVLSGKFLKEDVKGLWLWFGDIRVALKDQTKAGEMLILIDYELKELDGEPHLYLYTKEKGDDD